MMTAVRVQEGLPEKMDLISKLWRSKSHPQRSECMAKRKIPGSKWVTGENSLRQVGFSGAGFYLLEMKCVCFEHLYWADSYMGCLGLRTDFQVQRITIPLCISFNYHLWIPILLGPWAENPGMPCPGFRQQTCQLMAGCCVKPLNLW